MTIAQWHSEGKFTSDIEIKGLWKIIEDKPSTLAKNDPLNLMLPEC